MTKLYGVYASPVDVECSKVKETAISEGKAWWIGADSKREAWENLLLKTLGTGVDSWLLGRMAKGMVVIERQKPKKVVKVKKNEKRKQ